MLKSSSLEQMRMPLKCLSVVPAWSDLDHSELTALFSHLWNLGCDVLEGKGYERVMEPGGLRHSCQNLIFLYTGFCYFYQKSTISRPKIW